MMISTRGRYALRILVDLAERQTEEKVTLRELAERQGISEKYLESIVKELVNAGILEGGQGRRLSPAARPGGDRRAGAAGAHGRDPGPGGLPGGGGQALRPGGELPDPAPLAGPGRHGSGLPGSVHTAQPDAGGAAVNRRSPAAWPPCARGGACCRSHFWLLGLPCKGRCHRRDATVTEGLPSVLASRAKRDEGSRPRRKVLLWQGPIQRARFSVPPQGRITMRPRPGRGEDRGLLFRKINPPK